ncbi:MAG: patatin-like phospholipase family protein [Planctomycetota bacterium]
MSPSETSRPGDSAGRLPTEEPGVTLVLGGGGFKGMAHLGVLRVLQQHGIRIEAVYGTSVGALVGATYCWLGDAEQAHDLTLRFLSSEGFRNHSISGFKRRPGRIPLVSRMVSGLRRQVALERIFRRSSAFGGSALRFIVRSLVPKIDIRELRLPLSIGALDLEHGEVILMTRGDLCTAVTASGAVPGFFPPVEWEGRLLCDAGIVNNLPVAPARRSGATRLLAVDLSDGLSPLRSTAVGLDLLLRAQEISTRLANRTWGGGADLVIRPQLGGRHWLDTSDLASVISAGADAARQALPAIRALAARAND